MRKYSSRLASNHTTVRLEGNLLGCFNGLTSFGWVEDSEGNVVWEYSHDPEDDWWGEQYFPLFDSSDFVNIGGFTLVTGERAENVCKYPDNW